MPHIIVEYSSGRVKDVPALLQALHEGLAGHETIQKASIKTRGIEISDYVVGAGSASGFVHVVLKLLPGRADDLRARMSQHLFDLSYQHILPDTALSVEVQELDAATYCK